MIETSSLLISQFSHMTSPIVLLKEWISSVRISETVFVSRIKGVK